MILEYRKEFCEYHRVIANVYVVDIQKTDELIIEL